MGSVGRKEVRFRTAYITLRVRFCLCVSKVLNAVCYVHYRMIIIIFISAHCDFPQIGLERKWIRKIKHKLLRLLERESDCEYADSCG